MREFRRMDSERQREFAPRVSQRLVEIADELVALESETETVAPDSAIGRLSRIDAMQMQQMAVAQRQRLRDEEMRLREALQRIETGTFGRCQLCGQDIAIERLEYQPDAVVCIGCAKKKR